MNNNILDEFNFLNKKVKNQAKKIRELKRKIKKLKPKKSSFRSVLKDIASRQQCPICLATIMRKKDAIITDCNHKFHKECLNRWKESSLAECLNRWRASSLVARCPLCRQYLATVDETADDITTLGDGADSDITILDNDVESIVEGWNVDDFEDAQEMAEPASPDLPEGNFTYDVDVYTSSDPSNPYSRSTCHTYCFDVPSVLSYNEIKQHLTELGAQLSSRVQIVVQRSNIFWSNKTFLVTIYQ